MRFFNTAGPVRPDDHYAIPPLDRVDVDELLALIRAKQYFVLHAPRQTGKTSAPDRPARPPEQRRSGQLPLRERERGGRQVARDDVARGIRAILSSLATSARLLGDDYPDDIWPDVLTKVGPEDALKELLTRWCVANPTPLVLLVDEIDSLVGDTLLSVLRQLRAGYEQRPEGFPQSVVLCGVRDIRDYRIRSSAGEVIAGGSPFNVAAKSLRMGDFTEAETRALMAQHTEEDRPALLVGSAGFGVDADPGPAVAGKCAVRRDLLRQQGGAGPLADHRSGRRLRRAEELILSRRTHLDQLAHKLEEARVRRVIEPLLSDAEEPGCEVSDIGFQRDVDYVRDLGLIAPGPGDPHGEPDLRGGGAAGADGGRRRSVWRTSRRRGTWTAPAGWT